ncbi:kinetochore protein [Dorcoceras hygrometricum]|uniref:Kinetochore protein n=1 Tax=Dorcoceras hygrometricum TaxID=472368 RepID=A0A2Z7B6V8_9LAMI|nr:kinetochore protein [Dorcoceras hygrometricum]
MASSLIANALQVNFDSVLGISDNDGMVKMFGALESTGLHGFLGCPSVLYEKELEQFFDTALVKNNEILWVIHGKVVVITEERFAGVFELPTEGLTDLSEVPKNLVFDARTIHFELKVNWSKLLFDILKEMTDRSSKRAKGYAAQICVLLKGDPAVTLEEVKTFPPLKILSAKTVSTYVATSNTIDARSESDEPEVAKVAVVKRKSVSKKRSASTANKDTDEVLAETAHMETNVVEPDVAEEVEMGTDLTEPVPFVPYPLKPRTLFSRELSGDLPSFPVVVLLVRGRAAIPHSHLPAGIVVTMRRVVNYHSSWARQQQVELFDASGNLGSTAGRGFNPAGGAPGGKEIDPMPVEDVGQIPSYEESLSIDDLLKRIPGDMMLPSVTTAEPKQAIKLEWTRSCCATLFEGANFYRGFYIPRNHKTIFYTSWVRNFRFIKGYWLVEDGYDRCVSGCAAPVLNSRSSCLNGFSLVPVGPVLGDRSIPRRIVDNISYRIQIVDSISFASTDLALVPVGPVLGDRSIPRRIVDNISYRIQIVDSISFASTDLGIADPVEQVDADLSTDPVFADPIVQVDADSVFANQVVQMEEYQRPDPTASENFSHRIPDIPLKSPGQSNSADSRMLFTATDIPLNDEILVDQLVLPATALPVPDLAESLAQLRTFVSQLSIKQMRTTSSIGDLRNELLAKIDNIEKAAVEARTQQDHVFRDLIKSVKQEAVQDQQAALSQDLMEFRVQEQENYNNLTSQLLELVDYINRGCDAKKGESGSSRGPQHPPDDRDKSRPGGGGGGRSEPVNRRGSGSQSGRRRRGFRYWFGGE